MPEKQDAVDALFEELGIIGLHAVKQYAIGNARVALAFPKQKAAIEINNSFRERPEIKSADERRDAVLESMGWRVLRMREKDVAADPTKAALDVEHFVGDAPEIADGSEEEAADKTVSIDNKTAEAKASAPITKIAETQTPAKKAAETKIRQPDAPSVKAAVARKKVVKKGAKHTKPPVKSRQQKNSIRKQEVIREKPHVESGAHQKKHEKMQPNRIIGIALLLIALYLIYLLMA